MSEWKVNRQNLVPKFENQSCNCTDNTASYLNCKSSFIVSHAQNAPLLLLCTQNTVVWLY